MSAEIPNAITIGRCVTCRHHYQQECMHHKLGDMSCYDLNLQVDELVYSEDGLGGFFTGDNFGCVHWEAKS